MKIRSKFVLVPVLVCSAGLLVWTLQNGKGKVLLSGTFHSVAHKGTGEAQVVLYNGTRILQLQKLKTYPGSDLEVCLAGLPDAEDNETVQQSKPICLGPLN